MTQHPPESEHIDDKVVVAELVSESDASSLPPSDKNRLSFSGILSWLVVAAITAAIVMFVATEQKIASETVGGDATSGDLIQIQLAGKILVGQQEFQALAKKMEGAEPAEEDADSEDHLSPKERKAIETAITAVRTGTFEQQLASVVLTNELLGSEQALLDLNDLNQRVTKINFEQSENQSTLHDAVSNVVNACADDSFDDATLSIEEEELLDEKLGWIGRLAAAPELSGKTLLREAVIAEATNSAMIVSVASIAGTLALIVGFFLAFKTIKLWKRGELEGRFKNQFGTHNIYIETFAIWLVYFFGIQFAIGGLVEIIEIDPLVLSPFIVFSSLLALVWPVIRGIPFSQVRQDIGWTTTKPTRDFLAAPVGYLTTIPMLLLVLVSLVFIGALSIPSAPSAESAETEGFSRGQSISHPIQEYVTDSDANVFLWIALSTCVAAPIVEETVFRGILYRHLRDLTAHWRLTATVAFSSVLNAFIFAAIHPQGVMLIPVLGSLAVGFSLMREWRGSLYPSMIMHAIHNSLVTCLMFTIL